MICVLGVSPPAAASSAPRKLNVLLIAVDDLRDTLGCYGNAAVKTPHIDRLAARAVLMDEVASPKGGCGSCRFSLVPPSGSPPLPPTRIAPRQREFPRVTNHHALR